MTGVSKQIYKGVKCSNIISSLSEMYHITIEEATDIYYSSEMADLIDEGIADLHCRSDKYLATEIWDDYINQKQKQEL